MRSVSEALIHALVRRATVTAAVALLAASPGFAGTTTEIEPNDSFATRQVISPPIQTVNGEIADVLAVPDLNFSDTLPAGQVLDFQTMALTPDDPFIAWIDNDFGSAPNTLLGRFDSLDVLVGSDDDSSPIGTGTASALLGAVNADGTIRLSVTGSGDDAFAGAHSEAGEFDLLVTLDELDLDFFSFPALPSGAPFEIQLVTADTRKTLLWLDDSGVPIETLYFSFPFSIEGTVPPSGELNFAVTGGEDHEADGVPDPAPGADGRIGIGTGPYTLILVPEPSRMALTLTALTALLALPMLRRARRARPTGRRGRPAGAR